MSTKFGFTKDCNNLKFKEIFTNNAKLKTVYIDIYANNPLDSSEQLILLLRTYEKNAIISNNNNRFIIMKDDRFNTYIMNILLSEITECYYEIVGNFYEFVIKIRNTYYKFSIIN